MPGALQSAVETLSIMERFGYTLTQLNGESAELIGLLEMEALAKQEMTGGDDYAG